MYHKIFFDLKYFESIFAVTSRVLITLFSVLERNCSNFSKETNTLIPELLNLIQNYLEIFQMW